MFSKHTRTLILAFLSVICAQAQEIRFPNDPKAVLNVVSECGAKGDGVTDDTEALQNAIYLCAQGDNTRTIFVPKGIYRITRQLIFRPSADSKEGSMIGPWIYGQERDTTIIRLADGSAGFGDAGKPQAMVRGISRPDGSKMNADFFDRTLVNLTLDAGKNPGAIGLNFYSNNTGLVQDVRIVGNGPCGIDLGTNDQNGPLLIQDVEIDGFTTGLRTDQGLNSQTLSRITVKNAKLGVFHRRQVLSIEALRTMGVPQAIDSDSGYLTLVDCRFEGGDKSLPAILLGDKGRLYAQRLVTTGFTTAITASAAVPGGSAAGGAVAEYSSHGTTAPDGAKSGTGLGLIPLPEPKVAWETDPAKWVCANDFGMATGDNDVDDSAGLQAAIDHAAKVKATTVYLRGGKRSDPNWYLLKKSVKIHGSVRHLIGLGFVRLVDGGSDKAPDFPDNMSRITIEDEVGAPPVVLIDHLSVFAPQPGFAIENKATKRTVVVRSCNGVIIARKNSNTFVTNCSAHAYQEAGSRLTIRQWNPEGDHPASCTRNDGGTLWILGMKSERAGTKVRTLNGGNTEILGTLIYNTTGAKDRTPCLEVIDGRLSSACHLEINFSNGWYKVPVRQVLAGKESTVPQMPWCNWSLMRAGLPTPVPPGRSTNR